MSWYNTGYEATETAWDDVPFDGNERDLRLYIPYPNTAKGISEEDCIKRVLFLDDDPASFWEHQFKYQGNFKHREVCLRRNKALAQKYGGDCPPCDKIDDKYPYFVGLHSVIVMTPYFTKKHNTEMNFIRRQFAAKLGGKDKPGVLVKLRKLRERYGRLRGLIFDVERPGKKTEVCGSEFHLVEKLDPGEIKTYCMEQMKEYVERRNAKLPNDKQVTIEKLLEWNPWEPYDWDKYIVPKKPDELARMFGKGGGYEADKSFSDDDSGSRGSSKSDPVDDDIPY